VSVMSVDLQTTSVVWCHYVHAAGDHDMELDLDLYSDMPISSLYAYHSKHSSTCSSKIEGIHGTGVLQAGNFSAQT